MALIWGECPIERYVKTCTLISASYSFINMQLIINGWRLVIPNQLTFMGFTLWHFLLLMPHYKFRYEIFFNLKVFSIYSLINMQLIIDRWCCFLRRLCMLKWFVLMGWILYLRHSRNGCKIIWRVEWLVVALGIARSL